MVYQQRFEALNSKTNQEAPKEIYSALVTLNFPGSSE
jgi:hypothetical protein